MVVVILSCFGDVDVVEEARDIEFGWLLLFLIPEEVEQVVVVVVVVFHFILFFQFEESAEKLKNESK